MKNLQALSLMVLIAFLATYVAVNRVYAQEDFIAYKGAAIPDNEIDGIIGPEWADAGNYTVAIDPSGTAEVWTKQDGTNLYMAINFTADSMNPWVALQLGTTGCMDSSADFAVFGDDNLSPNGYTDAHILSGTNVVADSVQNGVGAINVASGNLVTIEMKKPLNSGDTAGEDIAWTEGNIYNLVIVWDSNGGGSSGGSTSHRSGTTPTGRSMLISGTPVPELTGMMLIAILIIATFSAAILARRMSSRRSLPLQKTLP